MQCVRAIFYLPLTMTAPTLKVVLSGMRSLLCDIITYALQTACAQRCSFSSRSGSRMSVQTSSTEVSLATIASTDPEVVATLVVIVHGARDLLAKDLNGMLMLH